MKKVVYIARVSFKKLVAITLRSNVYHSILNVQSKFPSNLIYIMFGVFMFKREKERLFNYPSSRNSISDDFLSFLSKKYSFYYHFIYISVA